MPCARQTPIGVEHGSQFYCCCTFALPLGVDYPCNRRVDLCDSEISGNRATKCQPSKPQRPVRLPPAGMLGGVHGGRQLGSKHRSNLL